jgi:PAS domain S-box-containing protein
MVLLGSAFLLVPILQLLPEWDFGRTRNAQHLVEHTLQALRASALLLATIVDAESGQRGYLLTGDNRQLAPYQTALLNQQQARQALRQLTANNAGQQARITRLDRLMETRLSEMSRILALYGVEGRSAALAAGTSEDTRVMDEIRDLLSEVDQEEYGLLRQHSKSAEAQAAHLTWTLRTGGALLLILLIVGGVVSEGDIWDHQRVAAASRENQERLQMAQHVARIGTFEWNLQTGVRQRTPELEAMYGLPPGGFDASRKSWLDLVHPEDREPAARRMLEALETGSFEAEWRVIWPDGTTRWIFGRAWAFKDDAGKPLRLVGAIVDVTERKEAELDVLRINAELEQRVGQRTLQLEAANRELEAFSYSVSHDLRAPLRGIDGWSLALAEDYDSVLDDRARQYLNRVRSEAQRMGHLIDDMLQLSRVTRGEMKSDTVDLTTLANHITARLRDAEPQRSMEFVIEPELVAVGDGRLLEIALTNLFSNAVKFTGARDKACIEFGRLKKEGETTFYVRDNGAGFNMDNAGKLFGAFQRLHKASEFPGSGIGLATVQRVVRRHGGRVWAEAHVNCGATFSFTLGASS